MPRFLGRHSLGPTREARRIGITLACDPETKIHLAQAVADFFISGSA